MSELFTSSDPVVNATDLNFNSGAGGWGLGAPSFTGSPAPGTDILAGAGVGSSGTVIVPQLGSSMQQITGAAGSNGWNTNAPGTAAGIAAQNATATNAANATAASFGAVASTWYVRVIVGVLGIVIIAAGLKMLGAPVPIVGRVMPGPAH